MNATEQATTTGNYFPCLGKVRSLPFKWMKLVRKIAMSLDHAQKAFPRGKTLQPGAINVSSSCLNIVTFDTHVLQKNEGLKVFLNIVL